MPESAAPATIIYEQPLNERVRGLLRLEHLFQHVGMRMRDSREWDSRIALHILQEIADLLGRSDLKGELIKELERHSNCLIAWQKNPAVDGERLNDLLGDLGELLDQLRDPSCQPGQVLRQDELITAIKQRSSIPGGTCNFDLPAYHHWLNQPADRRFQDIERWSRDLQIIRKGMEFALAMIRNSSNPERCLAHGGFFQKNLDANASCQLLRVILPASSTFFPEISGSRHRFTIRFLEQTDTRIRPVQASDDVEFELNCCML